MFKDVKHWIAYAKLCLICVPLFFVLTWCSSLTNKQGSYTTPEEINRQEQELQEQGAGNGE